MKTIQQRVEEFIPSAHSIFNCTDNELQWEIWHKQSEDHYEVLAVDVTEREAWYEAMIAIFADRISFLEKEYVRLNEDLRSN